MFYSLKGELIHIEPGLVVIECGGVGYKCLTTFTTQKVLPKVGNQAVVYTHLHVREDAMEIFGFATLEELSCYKMLTAINGVGPKAGLAILSELSAQQLALAISSSDVKSITRAQGIGPKIAQRIILELKDKLDIFGTKENSAVHLDVGSNTHDIGNIPKAIEALSVLGYSSGDVTPILSSLDNTLSVEQLISSTLKQLGKK